ncbi:MAG TPA: PilZ domain-containing protein [Syntrophobacteria bacterium]|nr:PilZ domain-containing protein [Syntrophobacteria bacterium]
MNIRKYLGLERRQFTRHPASVEVEFHVWDAVAKQPRTRNVRGRLTDISLNGACLQTNHTLIEGHHLLLDNDLEGNTPLMLSLPAEGAGTPWTLQAQVLWYNRSSVERKYQFDVGLQFVKVTPDQRQHLEALFKPAASP